MEDDNLNYEMENIVLKEEKYLVISDLHIGVVNDRANNCILNDFELIRIFDKCIFINDYKLILNGDIFDLWETGLLQGFEERCAEIIECHTELCKYLHKQITLSNIIYIIGNHDNVRCELLDMMKPVVSYNIHDKIHIEHGHSFDDVNNSKGDCLGKFFTKCFAFCERYSNNTVTDMLETIEKIVSPKEKYSNCAKQLLSSSKYEVVIFGHTHDAHYMTFENNKIYANCGSWCKKTNNLDATSIYILDGKIKVQNIIIDVQVNTLSTS